MYPNRVDTLTGPRQIDKWFATLLIPDAWDRPVIGTSLIMDASQPRYAKAVLEWVGAEDYGARGAERRGFVPATNCSPV
jgi:hypothetical protein